MPASGSFTLLIAPCLFVALSFVPAALAQVRVDQGVSPAICFQRHLLEQLEVPSTTSTDAAGKGPSGTAPGQPSVTRDQRFWHVYMMHVVMISGLCHR